MDMSAAALPPIHGPVTAEDTRHPRYPEYRRYRTGMTALMVEAAGFKDWLSCQERAEYADRWAEHPRFREFQQWCRDTQSGRRACRPSRDMPRGLCFPENFKVWLTGERW